MSRYYTLVNILDKLRAEAPPENKSYHPALSNVEELNHARCKAFIHLYLKVIHGLIDFKDREKYVTDGTNDGGVDGYYIDEEKKEIVFIQSKFRKTKKNFEEKPIALDELLKMDADRMSEGHTEYENGIKYNGKIQAMLKEFEQIHQISKGWSWRVVLLANLRDKNQPNLKRFTGDSPTTGV